jgi:aspartate racemase
LSLAHTHIALLGLGSQSTLFYLETLNAKYNALHGEYHTFPCILLNVDFNTLNPFLPQQFDTLIPALKTHLDACFTLPTRSVLIPNITLHETYDRGQLQVPIIHPLKLLVERLTAEGITAVTLFGSAYTMNSAYIRSYLAPIGITVHTPQPKALTFIDTLRQRVYAAQETKTDIATYDALIQTYSKTSHVVIACTELSILHPKISNTVKVFDLALLQIDAALSLSK